MSGFPPIHINWNSNTTWQFSDELSSNLLVFTWKIDLQILLFRIKNHHKSRFTLNRISMRKRELKASLLLYFHHLRPDFHFPVPSPSISFHSNKIKYSYVRVNSSPDCGSRDAFERHASSASLPANTSVRLIVLATGEGQHVDCQRTGSRYSCIHLPLLQQPH